MVDGLWLIYDVLSQDETIREYCYSERDDDLKIKFYEYPETADMRGNWVVLEPILNEYPSSYADSTWVTYDYLIHIEVWSRSKSENELLANHIRDLLWEAYRFKQADDHEEFDLGIYRDARRYKGKLHRI